MSIVDQYFDVWQKQFITSGLTPDDARFEWNEWVSGLDGELNNEYTQNEYSVLATAIEVINECYSESLASTN